jgi:hypothetical protein
MDKQGCTDRQRCEDSGSAVVGGDTDIELRDGNGSFGFVVGNKPHVKHGDKALAPSHGIGTLTMVDGAWRVSFVRLYGALIGVKGRPVKKEVYFSYSFGAPAEEGVSDHPDYAPPKWIIDFVRGFERRLSGTV